MLGGPQRASAPYKTGEASASFFQQAKILPGPCYFRRASASEPASGGANGESASAHAQPKTCSVPCPLHNIEGSPVFSNWQASHGHQVQADRSDDLLAESSAPTIWTTSEASKHFTRTTFRRAVIISHRRLVELQPPLEEQRSAFA